MFSLSRESEHDLTHGILEVVKNTLKRMIEFHKDLLD